MGKDERAKDLARGKDAKDATEAKDAREKILAAIRRAAEELGRAPSRGELRRITGVSHYRVLSEFPTLREAVRAAGLEPNPKGEKISTEDLLADWKRVAEKLGRRPSRAEYVREGKYSAGALTVRFGRWGKISTAKVAKSAKEKLPESPKVPKNPKWKNAKAAIKANGARYAESSDKANRARVREPGEFILRDFDRVPLAPLPTPLVGMRRVTEAVAQMLMNTLLPEANGNWQLAVGQRSNQPSALSIQPNQNRGFDHKGHPYDSSFAGSESLRPGCGSQRESGTEPAPRGIRKEGDLDPSLAVNAIPFDSPFGSAQGFGPAASSRIGLRPSASGYED